MILMPENLSVIQIKYIEAYTQKKVIGLQNKYNYIYCLIN